MIIECPHCESKVDGKVVGQHVSNNPEMPNPLKVVLVVCPVCDEALLGYEEYVELGFGEEGWVVGRDRLWPMPSNSIYWRLPILVKESLEEAEKCYHARAYSACAVMCGRSLEGLCKHFGTKSKSIAGGLKELLERKIIDERLFQWGDALRLQRNLSAHASGERITQEDARDILDFANAISEYIFVLSERFESFKKRQQKKLQGKQEVKVTSPDVPF